VDKIGVIRDQHLAQNAEIQAETIANNILKLQQHAKSKSQVKLENYYPADRMIIISLGIYDAIFVWKWFSFTGFIPALLKDMIEKKTICRYWKFRFCKPSFYNTKTET